MSILKVDNIQSYSGGAVTSDGNFTVSGQTNANDELKVNANGSGIARINVDNYFGDYYGGSWWRDTNNKFTNLIMGAEASTVLGMNSWSGSYDNNFEVKVDGVGVKFSDWNPGAGYTTRTWLEVPQLGDVSINTNTNVNGGVAAKDYITIGSGSANVRGVFLPGDALDAFDGAAVWTNESQNSGNIALYKLNGSTQFVVNSYNDDYSIDEAMFIKTSLANGVQVEDWSGTYLQIPAGGSPTFKRKTTIENALKLTPQDPLPAGSLGELAVSGSGLYFHNGTSWGLIS